MYSLGTKQKTGSSSGGSGKKRSPKSPRKSRTSPESEKPAKKEKRSKKNRSDRTEQEEKPAKSKKPAGRHDSARKSIRRQAKVESHRNPDKNPENPVSETGGAISGADLSDVFDEEYYEDENSMKYIEDRSNCRKK